MTNGTRRAKAGKAMYGPSAKGVNNHITQMPRYMGWRTMRYGPPEITFYPGAA